MITVINVPITRIQADSLRAKGWFIIAEAGEYLCCNVLRALDRQQVAFADRCAMHHQVGVAAAHMGSQGLDQGWFKATGYDMPHANKLYYYGGDTPDTVGDTLWVEDNEVPPPPVQTKRKRKATPTTKREYKADCDKLFKRIKRIPYKHPDPKSNPARGKETRARGDYSDSYATTKAWS